MNRKLRSLFQKWLIPILLVGPVLTFWDCSSLQKLAIRRPEVAITRVSLTGLSLQELTLLLQVRVTNPNPVGIRLAGLDYRLLVNERPFLKGEVKEQFSFPAQGADTVDIPLGIPWSDLFALTREFTRYDSIPYLLEGGLVFNLPIVGATRVPLRHRGTLPLPRIPEVRLEKLQLKRLSLSGADLVFQLQVENRNAFPLPLQEMQYRIDLNGVKLALGSLKKLKKLSANGISRLVVPVHLDFLSLGEAISSALTGNRPLDYRVSGRFFLSDSTTRLTEQGIPFEYGGKIKLIK